MTDARIWASGLYAGTVMHRRTRPRRHRLSYNVFSFLLDLDELPTLDRALPGFGHNRFNLLSFHDSDHGPGTDTPLRPWVLIATRSALLFSMASPMTPVGKRWMAEMRLDRDGARPGIEMLAFPVSAIMAAWAVAMAIAWSGAGTLSQGILAALVVGFAAIAQWKGQAEARLRALEAKPVPGAGT